MAVSVHGKATVEGIYGAVTYSAIVANGALDLLSADFTDAADITDRVDGRGEYRGCRVINKRKEVTITCLASISSGNSMADARKAVIMPPIPSVVTLSAFEAAAAAGLNGDYEYRGGGSIAYAAEWVRITLPLRKMDHETSANLTAAVSA